MNHRAVGHCPKGHTFKLGSCTAQVKRFFGGTKACGSKLFEQLCTDGTALTVTFDNGLFVALRCVKCHTELDTILCPECGAVVSVSAFRKEGFLSKLG